MAISALHFYRTAIHSLGKDIFKAHSFNYCYSALLPELMSCSSLRTMHSYIYNIIIIE